MKSSFRQNGVTYINEGDYMWSSDELIEDNKEEMIMKLSKCVYGVLVYNKTYGIGMVKGITNNVPNECSDVRAEIGRAVPLVEWSSGRTFGIHAGNIELYKD